ncbi:MAG: DUF4058 family protein [Limisphaerales bacterium]
MTTKNPFPGMNPFFEQRWRHSHTAVLMYLCDALQERLPPDLIAGAEEESVAVGGGQQPVTHRPDVQVREPWALKEPSAAEVISKPTSTPATEPIRVFLEEEIERWLEIREATGRLITAIELLSPSNKLDFAQRERYLRKRHTFLGGGANFVEIDLVRQGASVFPQVIRITLQQSGASYGVCVFRTTRPEEREVYPIRLRERLPAIRVPLRPADADVVLDLQPLIDQCHERGRYHLLDYRLPLEPPLGPDDAAWADQLLRQQHLL